MVLITIYGLIIAVLGGLFIFLLKDISKVGNRLLVSFFSTFATKYILDLINFEFQNELISQLSTTISLTLYVFLFLYLKYMSSDMKRIRPKHILYFLPANIILVYMILVGYDNHGNFWEENLHFQIIKQLTAVYIFAFLFLAFNVLKKHHREIKNVYSYKSVKINLIWVACIFGYSFVSYIAMIIWGIISLSNNYDSYLSLITYANFNQTIVLLVFMVLGIWQSSITPTQHIAEEDNEKEAIELDPYVKVLKAYMDEKKPFLDGNLTVENLADQLNVKRQYLSEIINTHLGTNFFNFIKEYRVNHVIDLMHNKESANIKLLYLAFDSGFNSKSAFNRAFKEVTGKTPSEYLENLN